MDQTLSNLTEADIRARCSDSSFQRGKSYYTGGAVTRRLRQANSLEAQVAGAHPYRVTVWVDAGGRLNAHCTCPYDWGGDCKHIVATLLAWINDPDSFQPPVDLQAILEGRSKKDLVALLLDIFAVHPDLVDDFEVVTGPDDQNLVQKAADLFDDMVPWGHLTEDQVETHMRLLARRADRLAAEKGQAELARKLYYTLVLGCVNLARSYGSYEIFSPNVPFDFAQGYNDLAVEQVAEHGPEIKAEIDELYRDLYDPDMLGLNEALSGVWCELVDHGLVEGEILGKA